ncbi:hypothetical protein COLO4_29941 [Corchorus olitorius]|uniref:Reverse transcriptase/retrotransposon-derived protein RNase H-like domain-containing protein n=1 Tax=Corchorus olitorius TaxID=93759 RepID=A0A1R3HCC3_9ROSI|nr:hypothetical protein COLO4_29941 [Corchorus olitorius]
MKEPLDGEKERSFCFNVEPSEEIAPALERFQDKLKPQGDELEELNIADDGATPKPLFLNKNFSAEQKTLGEIVAPFQSLLKKGVTFTWGDLQHKAFEKVKDILTAPTAMTPPVKGQPMMLYLSSTNEFVGLVQEVEGMEKPVYEGEFLLPINLVPSGKVLTLFTKCMIVATAH